MWLQFFLENIHFAISMLTALVFFAIFWLYLDAWNERKTLKDGYKVIGFFLLSISFVIFATIVESTILSVPLLGHETNSLLVLITSTIGFLFIIVSLIIDPLQKRPQTLGLSRENLSAGSVLPFSVSSLVQSILLPLSPFLAVVTEFLYLRRATSGLENHLKPVAVGFFILSIFELLQFTSFWQNTNNIDIYNLVAPFGLLWIVKHLILLPVIFVLGRWVLGYLLKRFQSQLFIILTASILMIFLLTTVSFSALLIKNLQDETLAQLKTNVKVLNYAIESKKSESVSDAEVFAQNPQIEQALVTKSYDSLSILAQQYLLTKKQDTLVVVDENGRVVSRGEDKNRVGGSNSDDPLIKMALSGASGSSMISTDGVLSKELSIRSAAPINAGDKRVGAVMISSRIDNAFVDGIKKATNLEASVYGGNKLSASTIALSDGTSRSIGVQEENESIKTLVLNKGQEYSGPVEILSTSYFGAYLPLKDIDNNIIGMLSVGRPQVGILQAASRSIELTFLVAVLLVILTVFPTYLVSKYLSEQMK